MDLRTFVISNTRRFVYCWSITNNLFITRGYGNIHTFEMVAAVTVVILINAQCIYYLPSCPQSVKNKLEKVFPAP